MSSLSFISLILLLTADTYFGEYLVCTPCAVVDNEVFVLFRSRYFYRDTLFADCIRGKQHEFDVQLLGTCKHNLAERWRSGFSSFQVVQLSSSSSQLVISSVQHLSHAGQYHCVANTSSGQVETSSPFTITVHCEWKL